jgi:hypothetical protein
MNKPRVVHPAHDQPIAVVFDLVHPAGPGRWLVSEGRNARVDEAVGANNEHVRDRLVGGKWRAKSAQPGGRLMAAWSAGRHPSRATTSCNGRRNRLSGFGVGLGSPVLLG